MSCNRFLFRCVSTVLVVSSLPFVRWRGAVAVGETVILLHPHLPLLGVSIGMERGVPVKRQSRRRCCGRRREPEQRRPGEQTDADLAGRVSEPVGGRPDTARGWWCRASQRGISSKNMALITSECGATRVLSVSWS